MKPVLVGSRALAYHLNDFKCKDNSDWDILCSREEAHKFVPIEPEIKVETHFFDELNNREMCELYAHDDGPDLNPVVNGVECQVMSLAGLAVMKRSHLWRVLNFEKHITMYHKHLVAHLPFDRRLLDERIKLTKEAYPQSNPSLRQTNSEFFDDSVPKEFDHDWIHELVAYYDRPLYERLKRDDKMDEAWCEKDLWELLSYEDQCRCVAEECHVIACERFMIPSNWEHPSKLAYFKALNKASTTLCSGWFRDFAIDNFPEIAALYNVNKFKYVKEKTDERRANKNS